MSYHSGSQIIIIPSGCLSNQEICLQCKSPDEAIFYQFSLANRLSPTDNIVDVSAYPCDEAIIVDELTVSGQTFKAKISGGIMNMKCGIRFVVTTDLQEIREFDVTLPIAPAGIVGKGCVGDYIIGNTGPRGEDGKDSSYKNDGSVDLNIKSITSDYGEVQTDGDANLTVNSLKLSKKSNIGTYNLPTGVIALDDINNTLTIFNEETGSWESFLDTIKTTLKEKFSSALVLSPMSGEYLAGTDKDLPVTYKNLTVSYISGTGYALTRSGGKDYYSTKDYEKLGENNNNIISGNGENAGGMSFIAENGATITVWHHFNTTYIVHKVPYDTL